MYTNPVPYTPYNRAIKNYAQQNRSNSTKAEWLIRNLLLKQRPCWYKFLRQKPIGPFIADFYCSALGIVIEIDGSSHDHKADYDARRTAFINQYGIIVIRYTNKQVINHVHELKQDLERVIWERERYIQTKPMKRR